MFWPLGLVGRVSVVMVVAVVLVFMANTVFYNEAESFIVNDVRFVQLGDALNTDLRVLSSAPPNQRSFLAVVLSGSELDVSWEAHADLPNLPNLPQHHSVSLQRLVHRLSKDYAPLAKARLDLYTLTPNATDVLGTATLPDGSVMRYRVPGLMQRHTFTRGLAAAAITAGAVSIAAAMLIQGLSLPLRALSAAAERVGSNEEWTPLPERGPREVRGVVHTINAMQTRIQSLLDDRTQALAAVSHDLRTPLTRLRLRSGFLNDEEAQAAIEADLDEMETMVNGVLAYLSGVNDPETARATDIVATVFTLVDDFSDMGRDARYEGPEHLRITVRPLAMKRVLSNLIENGLNYGGRVLVEIAETKQGWVDIQVSDNGPGIPESERERVLTPFYRLEGSRSRQTGGIGLGLAIVLREVQREGGTFRLGQGDVHKGYGGLCAMISLPYEKDATKEHQI
ncbi:two component sensor histidine kinase [Neokomagataea thailandica NBRC 106555]|uniref:histidine kinase n=2 Tax=Neokomagataea TaxID=1223423 RepID=A0A4Y6V7W4_9PROT|nr:MULTISPECIES: ATP-binding protein [Neokomagataea]QDH24435.1 HAMP domain-containing protein [Neokomagataea tanensis]GBR50824.1 two component sensor histidine kinase [Neokomagataea thailandica NBRC 106555]